MESTRYIRYNADTGEWKLTCNRQTEQRGQGLDSAIECEKQLKAKGTKYKFVWENNWW